MESIHPKIDNIMRHIDTPNVFMELIEDLIIQYKDNIPIRNIINKLIIDNIKYFNVDIIAKNNLSHVFEICLQSAEFDYHEKYGGDTFFHIFNSVIVEKGDVVDILKVLIDYLIEHPSDDTEYKHFHTIDMELVFKTALVEGFEKIMHYALDNCVDNECEYDIFEYDKTEFGVYDFDDTVTHAIIGQNLNNVKYILDYFEEHIKDENWKSYVVFAAIHGTLDIVHYLLTHKPFLIEQIDDFYNKMLQYGLYGANINVVQWALNNGAEFTHDMHEKVIEFINKNPYYGDDTSGYEAAKYIHTRDFEDNFKECMKLVHNS